MPVDTLFEKLRFAERRLTAAEERVSFCRAAVVKSSAVLGGECILGSRDVTANENAVIRLMEVEQEYAEVEQQYMTCAIRFVLFFKGWMIRLMLKS